MDQINFLDEAGVTADYGDRRELYRVGLDGGDPYSRQVFGAGPVADAIAAFCSEARPVRVVLAGWIDQAVVEVRAVVVSDSEVPSALDEYRPEQGGDIGLYFCGEGDRELLEVALSREIGRLTVTRYKRSQPCAAADADRPRR